MHIPYHVVDKTHSSAGHYHTCFSWLDMLRKPVMLVASVGLLSQYYPLLDQNGASRAEQEIEVIGSLLLFLVEMCSSHAHSDDARYN